MSLLDDELRMRLSEYRERKNTMPSETVKIEHTTRGGEAFRQAVLRVLRRMDEGPMVDTWGCTHPAHIVTMVERLGAVSAATGHIYEVQRGEVEGNEIEARKALVDQLAELGANVLTMLTDELRAIQKLG
jgi:hypothetical protein